VKKPPKPPDSYYVGQELNWEAPWVDVSLRVELPFWLMMANATIQKSKATRSPSMLPGKHSSYSAVRFAIPSLPQSIRDLSKNEMS
jgi:hypothetical protein